MDEEPLACGARLESVASVDVADEDDEEDPLEEGGGVGGTADENRRAVGWCCS